jgi:hypothetical protein
VHFESEIVHPTFGKCYPEEELEKLKRHEANSFQNADVKSRF